MGEEGFRPKDGFVGSETCGEGAAKAFARNFFNGLGRYGRI